MIIKQNDFYKFDEKVKAAKTITDDYERIKSGEKIKELERDYKKTRDNFLETYEMYQGLKKENENLNEENKDLNFHFLFSNLDTLHMFLKNYL